MNRKHFTSSTVPRLKTNGEVIDLHLEGSVLIPTMAPQGETNHLHSFILIIPAVLLSFTIGPSSHPHPLKG